MNNSTIFYQHLNVGYTNKMTIAIQRHNDHYLVGYALCNPSDNYCKQTGRDIAVVRMSKDPLIIKLSELQTDMRSDNIIIVKSTTDRWISELTLDDIRVSSILRTAHLRIRKHLRDQ